MTPPRKTNLQLWLDQLHSRAAERHCEVRDQELTGAEEQPEQENWGNPCSWGGPGSKTEGDSRALRHLLLERHPVVPASALRSDGQLVKSRCLPVLSWVICCLTSGTSGRPQALGDIGTLVSLYLFFFLPKRPELIRPQLSHSEDLDLVRA